MDITPYVQEAQRRLDRMSEGSATEADYVQYAHAYRTLQRHGYRLPAEWPPPQAESKAPANTP